MRNWFRLRSVWSRLILGLSFVSIFAVVVAGAVLYIRFRSTTDEFRDRTLQSEAHRVAKVVRRLDTESSLQNAIEQLAMLKEGGRVAIVSEDGALLAASAGVVAPLWAVSSRRTKDYFFFKVSDQPNPVFGTTVLTQYAGRPVRVQIAFDQPEIFFDSVLQEFVEDIGWIWIPFVICLVGTNLLVARSALKPLRLAAAQAEAISPGATRIKLDEEGLPLEVGTLVRSINSAMSRLHQALETQSNFIADASHELRTPISVMKAHIDILPPFAGKTDLQDDINGLARLVDQLLDFARVDAIDPSALGSVDLSTLAVEVASHIAPAAVLNDRHIEVTAPPQSVVVSGNHDAMFRAIRNLVENGLKHTPKGDLVTVKVELNGSIIVQDKGPGIPPELRSRIFEKYWQGRRDRGKGGAGLGMDIVRRTTEALGGTVHITDAPGGGASIELAFKLAGRAPLAAG